MALFGNVLSQPSVAKVSEGEGNGSSEDDKGRSRHRFSEPWEDSDLILLVEDEKSVSYTHLTLPTKRIV